MSEKLSRRDFNRRAVGAAAVAAVAPLAQGQATQPKPPAVTDAEVTHVLQQLAKPLPDAAKKILRDDLANMKSTREQRLKHKLPENSEPCFVFVPTPKRDVDE